MIHKIPPECFDQGYQYFSFDVTSSFTKVPLNKTINIIMEKIYREKLVNTQHKVTKVYFKKIDKRLLHKNLAFSFNGIICKRKDRASMGSSLGPVLANIIMTELKRVIVEPLITSGKIKFYIRYVDDTLLLAKEDDMYIFDKYNSFHKNFKFTKHTFDDNNIHFLDIAIDKSKTDLYYKPTHTGQYSDIAMFHGIIKVHGLNPFTTEQTKFVHQPKSLDFKLTR